MTSETTILILLSAALAASMLVFLLLWRQLQQVQRYCRQLNTAVQRQERDVAQLRYGLAMLRQQRDKGSDATDEQMMDLALTHADDETGHVAPPAPTDEVVLGDLKQGEILQFLKKAIKNNQIAISLQPIMKMPQRVITFYEVFARIGIGAQFIPAHQFIAVARDNHLMAAVDNILLLRCLQMIKQQATGDSSTAYFVNVSGDTLGNKTYVQDLISFLSANPKISSRLVFEITQKDSLALSPESRQVMEGLALLGCRFSMDQVSYMGLDIARLVDQNIRFIKLDGRVLAHDVQQLEKRGRLKKLKAMLESNGITVIMEKIEDERQLMAMVDLYVDYAQGYLFGTPETVTA